MKKMSNRICGLLPMLAAAIVTTPQANATETWGSCTVAGVAVFENRIHVRCSTPIAGITYFAVSTADAQNAARFLTGQGFLWHFGR